MKEEIILEVLEPMNHRFFNRIESHLLETCNELVTEFELIVIENEYSDDLVDIHMLVKTFNNMEYQFNYECIREGEYINVIIYSISQPESMSNEEGEREFFEIVKLLKDEYNHVSTS